MLSTLDENRGNWKIKVEKPCKVEKGFNLGLELYNFIGMPSGLGNAPATF